MANDNKDQELIEIFLEEAADLIAAISGILQKWKEDLSNFNNITDLKRELHTLKGSARMIGQKEIGTLAHEMETLCDALAKGQVPIDRTIFEEICLGLDHISTMIEALRKNEPLPAADTLIQTFHNYLPDATKIVKEGGPLKDSGSSKTHEPTHEPTKENLAEELSKTTAKPTIQAHTTGTASTGQDVIRVRSTLLETLNNLSSENSMIRVGMEQKVYATGDNLRKLKQSVKHLDSQLNILNTDARASTRKGVFHPTLQALTSDTEKLVDYDPMDESHNIIKEIMVELKNSVSALSETHSSMESLLLHQNRITSELQHRLAETRLTPFESIVPRLSRIARQVSLELNKQVDFKVTKSQGEMDRTILEHLVPSLEHILRNALDHGIESIEERKKHGKPEIGKIEVNFLRSGSIAAITLKDDGGGIDANAVRKKAIKMGLLQPDVEISDEEAIRYILEPGFSTREAVTEVSGRGVGMDVVNTAVNELGGTLHIESQPGLGTTFTVRFPFTSSLNRILLFTLENDTYGITLTGIDGITSIDDKKLQHILSKQPAIIRHGSKGYYLHLLSTLLNPDMKVAALPIKNSYPLLLISSQSNSIAILVDSILYSRDLLVQALGVQFKLTDEFSGATLLGDGHAVLIFDPDALTRKAKILQEQENIVIDFAKSIGVVDKTSQRVMVVDDSASIRALLQKSLERHHYHVNLAEDGADALLKLQTTKTVNELPDSILLDIDMPNMNGLELAEILRNTEKFKHIPIIILTSDATNERREQAEELKIEAFLEKPVDELQVIAALQSIAGKQT